MSILLRQLLRHVAQKVANNPEIRTKAIKVAGDAFTQAKQISKEKDRARAAGRAFRRALGRLQNKE